MEKASERERERESETSGRRQFVHIEVGGFEDRIFQQAGPFGPPHLTFRLLPYGAQWALLI